MNNYNPQTVPGLMCLNASLPPVLNLPLLPALMMAAGCVVNLPVLAIIFHLKNRSACLSHYRLMNRA